MKKITAQIFGLSCLLSLGVEASTSYTPSDPIGFMPIKHEVTSKVVSQHSVASEIVQSQLECTASELNGMTQQAFVSYIHDNTKDCLSFLFQSPLNEQIYAKERVLAVAEAAEKAAIAFDGFDDYSNYFMYLRAMLYVQFYYNKDLFIDEAMLSGIIKALDATQAISGFTSNNSDVFGALIYEWIGTADSTNSWAKYHTTVVNFLSAITDQKAARYYNQIAYNSALVFLFRGQSNDPDGYGATTVAKDTQLPTVLSHLALNAELRSSAGYVSDNAVNELTRLFQWQDIAAEVIGAIQQIIEANPRLSKQWMMVVSAIKLYNIDCTRFSGEVCDSEALRQEVIALVFPNEFEFDGGAMKFYTPLSRNEVEQLFYQLKETQATFFKVTGATEPVLGDTSDVAHFRIYGSRQDYEIYQSYLYGLSSNNGGIYIERDATLYTYDREDWQSQFTLEELARHEYVHYLVSRYLVPGYWGETELYQNERLTWFDEGMANFIAGGTQAEGIHPLHTMLNMVSERSLHYTPNEAVQVRYGDPFMYPYSALFLNFLYDNKSALLKSLFAALRADDVLSYDTLREQLSAQSTNDFSAYISDSIQSASSYGVPWKYYPKESSLPLTAADDVESEVISTIDNTLSNVRCSEASVLQFTCEGELSYHINDIDDPLFEVFDQLNAIALKFMSSPSANLQTANLYPISVTSEKQLIRFEGGLRRNETPYLPNKAPIATDSFENVDVGSRIEGQMSATDENGDTLTFTVVDPVLTGNLNWHESGSYSYEADDLSFSGDITFTFKATDGLLESNLATVTITVKGNDPEPTNTAPVASNGSVSVEEGKSVSGSMVATDSDGDAVTYLASNPAHGTLTYDAKSGAFTYTPTTGFNGIDSFTFTAADDTVESNTATITITVTAKPSTGGGTGGSNGGSDSSNSASGGAFGVFGLLMIAIAALRRIKMIRPVFLILITALTLQGCDQGTLPRQESTQSQNSKLTLNDQRRSLLEEKRILVVDEDFHTLDRKQKILDLANEYQEHQNSSTLAELSYYYMEGKYGLNKNIIKSLIFLEAAFASHLNDDPNVIYTWKEDTLNLASYYGLKYKNEIHAAIYPEQQGFSFLINNIQKSLSNFENKWIPCKLEQNECYYKLARDSRLNIATVEYLERQSGFSTTDIELAALEAVNHSYTNFLTSDALIRILGKRDFNVNFSSNLNNQPPSILYGALANGDFQLANYLLKKGAKTDLENNDSVLTKALSTYKLAKDKAPKHPYAQIEADEFIRLAVAKGANIEGTNWERKDAIMIAAERGLNLIVDTLLELGANPEKEIEYVRIEGIYKIKGKNESAITLAAKNRNFHLKDIFEKHGYKLSHQFLEEMAVAEAEAKAEKERRDQALITAKTHPFSLKVDCTLGGYSKPIYGCLGKHGSIEIIDQTSSQRILGTDFLYDSSIQVPLPKNFRVVVQNGDSRHSRLDVFVTDIVSNKSIFWKFSTAPFETIAVEN